MDWDGVEQTACMAQIRLHVCIVTQYIRGARMHHMWTVVDCVELQVCDRIMLQVYAAGMHG